MNTDLSHSVFVWCNLTEVKFGSAKLVSTIFEKCNLSESDFTGADITGAGFENSHIDKTLLDVEGFVSFGGSKGFKLSQ